MSTIGGIPGAGAPMGAQAAASRTAPQDKKLMQACREMEGYFVGGLLKKMHESASKDAGPGESSETATFREMFDDAVGRSIGQHGSFGIADALYKELSHHVAAPVGALAAPGLTGSAAGAAAIGAAAQIKTKGTQK